MIIYINMNSSTSGIGKVIHTTVRGNENVEGRDRPQFAGTPRSSINLRDLIRTDNQEDRGQSRQPNYNPIGRMTLVNKFIVEWSTHSVMKLFGYLSTAKDIDHVTFSLNSGNEAYSLIHCVTKLSLLELHRLIDKAKVWASHFKIRQVSALAAK